MHKHDAEQPTTVSCKIPPGTMAEGCPVGFKEVLNGSDGTRCCEFDAGTLKDFNKEHMPAEWQLMVSGGIVGLILMETTQRLAGLGIKMGTKAMMETTTALLRAAERVSVEIGAKVVADTPIYIAEASTGPPGWVMIVLQIMTVIVDFWDPENFNAFQANRLNVVARNMMIAEFDQRMRKSGGEPPYIFPIQLVYPKEFQAALQHFSTTSISKFLATLDEKEQAAWWLSKLGVKSSGMKWTCADELRAKKVDAAFAKYMDSIDPKERDTQLYMRLCYLVGKDNVDIDTSLSTKSRIAVTISQSRADAYNELVSKRASEDSTVSAPMAVVSKYYFVPDGTQTVDVAMGMPGIMEKIGDAAKKLNEHLGQSIAPTQAVPKLKRETIASGKAIAQMNMLGDLKYHTCMGPRDCSKAFGFLKATCAATEEKTLNYKDYGVSFDDDNLMCKYTCQLCERFGLVRTSFKDETVSNTDVTIEDCKFFPGQDLLELIVGTTVVRSIERLGSNGIRGLKWLEGRIADAYNGMCDGMKPGDGKFCPTHCGVDCGDCDKKCSHTKFESVCDDSCHAVQYNTCRAECRLEPKTSTKACEDRCNAYAEKTCGPVCKTIEKIVVDPVCKAGCYTGCGLKGAECELRLGMCAPINAICKWTDKMDRFDTKCVS